MKFILKINKNITKDSLISELKDIGQRLNGQYLSQSKYKELRGQHSTNTFTTYFGSWSSALRAAGLPPSRNSNEMKRISDEAIIEDVIRVANTYGTKTITSTQYGEKGNISLWTITQRFGSWTSLLEKAHLMPTGTHTNISDEDLLKEVERVWLKLGKQPTTDDIKKGISIYNLSTFTRRFGGWRATLETFVKYINGEIVYKKSHDTTYNKKKALTTPPTTRVQTHRTKREPSNRLKIQVLMRDGNKCRICGVECNDGIHNIHFDHIIPWSKGGETVLENLQVLCHKCNLAKGDI